MDHSQQLQQLVEQVLSKLGVTGTVTIQERENAFFIAIESEDSALLIGKAGETLVALQTIVRLLAYRLELDGARLTVDVNGYRRQQEESLLVMVDQVCTRVKETGQPETLRPMSAYERRLVHEVVGAVEGIESMSEGEGVDRRITVRPI